MARARRPRDHRPTIVSHRDTDANGSELAATAWSAPKAEPALRRIGRPELLGGLALVREGRVFDLGLELNGEIPQGIPDLMAGFRLSRLRSSTEARSAYGVEVSTEIVVGTPHVSTHIDALCHFAVDGRIFGGASVSDAHTDFGWREHGIETVPPIIGRGILLDVPGLLEVERLHDGFEITADHLRGCLRRQAIDLHNGDIVLVRTGKIGDFHTDPERYLATQPGVGTAAAIWAFQRGMAVLGTDTASTEPAPFVDPPRTTHAAMLVERGVHLIETLDLDELAGAGCHEFAFVCLPLAMTGATASWVRPVAIR